MLYKSLTGQKPDVYYTGITHITGSLAIMDTMMNVERKQTLITALKTIFSPKTPSYYLECYFQKTVDYC